MEVSNELNDSCNSTKAVRSNAAMEAATLARAIAAFGKRFGRYCPLIAFKGWSTKWIQMLL